MMLAIIFRLLPCSKGVHLWFGVLYLQGQMDFFRTPTGFTYGIRVSLRGYSDNSAGSCHSYYWTYNGFFFLIAGWSQCKSCTVAWWCIKACMRRTFLAKKVVQIWNEYLSFGPQAIIIILNPLLLKYKLNALLSL